MNGNVIVVESHDVYVKWRDKFRDVATKARIARRIKQIEKKGLFGDQAFLGDAVWELRIHCGPGYRLYYTRQNDAVILLLCGGDKSTQAKDIDLAKQLAKEVKSGTEE